MLQTELCLSDCVPRTGRPPPSSIPDPEENGTCAGLHAFGEGKGPLCGGDQHSPQPRELPMLERFAKAGLRGNSRVGDGEKVGERKGCGRRSSFSPRGVPSTSLPNAATPSDPCTGEGLPRVTPFPGVSAGGGQGRGSPPFKASLFGARGNNTTWTLREQVGESARHRLQAFPEFLGAPSLEPHSRPAPGHPPSRVWGFKHGRQV